MAQEVIQWTSPAPLWPQAISNTDLLARRKSLRRPAILRFASDEFMDQFLRLLGNDPARLNELIAKPETWRGAYPEPEPVKEAPAFARKLQRLGLIATRNKNGSPAVTAVQVDSAQAKKKKLKLYQPAHQRYYLIAASLVCGRAGLPDRALAPARQERVGFVVRRLMPSAPLNIRDPLPPMNPDEWPNNWDEYAFVAGQGGAGWKRILKEKRNSLEDGEERLPLFAVHFDQDDGRRRRLFAGLVPVGKREAYLHASQLEQTGDPPPVVAPSKLPDPRMMIVWSQVTEPWKRLIERAEAAKTNGAKESGSTAPWKDDDPPAGANSGALKAAREQIQTGSWYALLDLAKFLEEHIGNVWQALHGQTPQSPLTPAQNNLIAALTGATLSTQLRDELKKEQPPSLITASTLKEALALIRPADGATAERLEENLDKVTKSYDRKSPDPLWPDFLFPLADPAYAAPLPPAEKADDPSKLEDRLERLNHLAKLIEEALPPQPSGEAPAIPLAAKPVMDTRESWFVIRCVFERPECGPIDPPLLSEPTEPFQM